MFKREIKIDEEIKREVKQYVLDELNFLSEAISKKEHSVSQDKYFELSNFQYAFLERIDTIENNITDKFRQIIDQTIKKEIQSEEFIDKIIERILKKQLK